MKQKILGLIASLFIRFLGLSYRYQLKFEDADDEKLFFQLTHNKRPDKSSCAVIAFFHQDELALLPYFNQKKLVLMVSQSKDGEIMATATRLMGHIPVRGSSSRGAVGALIACIKKMREGYTSAMAVDGPRGPIYKVKEGTISLSEKTNSPIIPIRCFIDRAWVFTKAWNQAKLPKPFSQITLRVSKINKYSRDELEQTLTQDCSRLNKN